MRGEKATFFLIAVGSTMAKSWRGGKKERSRERSTR
jgi:hypothetical protein